jgi:uncharacterized protein YgiM (DUF1202 family)
MASGRLLIAATLSLATSAAVPTALFAQGASAQEAAQTGEAGAHQGRVTANGVYVRSRASEDAYPTMKLKKDQIVTVVGVKGVWLKIVPPPGSFAYVPKSFVILRGDGTVGRMSREWIARVGSSENELAAEPMATLHEGEDVTVIGQHNEYFEIKPPKDSYVWVNKQFVEPIATPAPDTKVAAKDNGTTPPQTGEKTASNDGGANTVTPAKGNATAKTDSAGPATRPSEKVADAGATTGTAAGATAEAEPPATRPAYDALAEFDKLEQQYAEANKKPILEQPLGELLNGYKKVTESDELPSSMRQIAQIRIASLQVRNDAREKFLAVQSEEKKMAAKQQSLLAERTEIEDRIKQNNLEIFTAVGTLRTSSLQVGNTMLYRLTDPSTGRTVAYVRTNDPKYGSFLGQFIGVRGTIANDSQLKSVIENPSDARVVDQSKVNKSIVAQLVPPSLIKLNAPQPVFTAPTANSGKATEGQGQASIDKQEQPQN